MAKQKKASKAKKAPYAEIVSLLTKLQDRIDTVSNRVTLVGNDASQSRDTIASFNRGFGVYSTGQSEKNKKFTDSLYALRDSTAKAFDNVTADMKNALAAIQRLGERIDKLENKVSIGSAAWHQMVGVEKRVTELENKGDSIPVHTVAERLKQIEARAKYYEEKLDAVHATVQSLFAYPQIKGKDASGEFIYIHPLDLAEIMEKLPVSEVVVFRAINGDQNMVTIGKTRYLQSAYIPRRPGQNKIV